MSNKKKEFYTVRGYALLNQEKNNLTPSMEDYLEMIYRLSQETGYTRMGDLASALNVQPPSASKMVNKIAELGYINYEKYGIIQLSKKGQEIGHYLLERHKTVEDFLTILGIKNNILEETEKIEHNISFETLEKLQKLVNFFKENKEILTDLQNYLQKL